MFVRRDWSESSKMRPITNSEIDTWYATLVRTLLMAVPQLEELCISDHHRSLYRGTRVKNTYEVEVEWLRDSDEEHRFPSILTS
jgi:hypothetical protein